MGVKNCIGLLQKPASSCAPSAPPYGMPPVPQAPVYPTNSAYPTSSPYPNNSAYPTSSPYPTNSAYPTSSPYPTNSSYPTSSPYSSYPPNSAGYPSSLYSAPPPSTYPPPPYPPTSAYPPPPYPPPPQASPYYPSGKPFFQVHASCSATIKLITSTKFPSVFQSGPYSGAYPPPRY